MVQFDPVAIPPDPYFLASELREERSEIANRARIIPPDARVQALGVFGDSLRSTNPGTVSIGTLKGKRGVPGVSAVRTTFPDESCLTLCWWRVRNDDESYLIRCSATSDCPGGPSRMCNFSVPLSNPERMEGGSCAHTRMLSRLFMQFAEQVLAPQRTAQDAELSLIREFKDGPTLSVLLKRHAPLKPTLYLTLWREGWLTTYYGQVCMPNGGSVIVEGPLNQFAGPTLFRSLGADGYVRNEDLIFLSSARSGRYTLKKVMEWIGSATDERTALERVQKSHAARPRVFKAAAALSQFGTWLMGSQHPAMHAIFERRLTDDGTIRSTV